MDVLKTVREIGFFEMGGNLADVLDSEEVVDKIKDDMLLPNKTIKEEVVNAAQWLTAFNKSKYMFLNPEIALIDAIAKNSTEINEFMVLIPCDMDTEINERLKNNLPKNTKSTLLNEPYFPQEFYPNNGILVACGYMAGERLMVLPETYRMIEHYSGFLGKKVFIPYSCNDVPIRYDGWIEIGSDKFNSIWRA